MAGKPVHTVPHEDGWANTRPDADKASGVFNTKAEAQDAGKTIAKNQGVEHILSLIHI